MGRTACTEPQCLYKGALYLTSVPVQGCTLPYLSACRRVHFTLLTLLVLVKSVYNLYIMFKIGHVQCSELVHTFKPYLHTGKLDMLTELTNARKCMKVRYTHCVAATCFGRSRGHLQGGGFQRID